MATKISVKDPNTARDWLRYVQQIDQDYRRAMQDAANSLESMGEFMEGTAVDEFVQAGSNLLTAAENTFNAIETISDTVNNILSFVSDFTQTVAGGIGSIAKAIFG